MGSKRRRSSPKSQAGWIRIGSRIPDPDLVSGEPDTLEGPAKAGHHVWGANAAEVARSRKRAGSGSDPGSRIPIWCPASRTRLKVRLKPDTTYGEQTPPK